MSRLSYKSLILILLFLLIPIVLFLRINQRGKEVSAEWFNESWNYRQRVDITNSSGSDLTDFQVSFDIGTSALIAAGKMQSDCDDIRITDQNGNLLPYWIEENNPGCNQVTDTKIWVKAPSLPTSGAPVYFYYGNSSTTSAQNGNDVFEFFDDFSTYTGWSGNTSDFTSSTDGSRTVIQAISSSNPSIILKPITAPTNYVVEVDIKDSSETSNNPHPGFIFAGTGSSSYNAVYLRSAGNQVVSASYGSYGVITNSQNIDNNWNTLKAYVSNGFLTSLTFNDTVQTSFNNWDINDSFTQIGLWSYTYEFTAYYDNLKVRKYSSPEPTATPQSEEIGGGPIAYWKFDEGVGTTAYDSSSNQNNGLITGATWKTEEQCIVGKCLNFNGTSNYVSTNFGNTRNVSDNPITISTWVNPINSNIGTSVMFIGSDNGTNQRLYLAIYNGKWDMGVQGSTWGGAGPTKNVDYSKWTHITLVMNGSSALLYVNGQFSFQKAYTSYSLASNITIGRHGSSSAFYWPGLIDEVKIYPYARTADQIKADYASGLAGMGSSSDSSVNIGGVSSGKSLSDGLVGYWKMDESSWNGTAGEVIDSSGNNNSGYAFGSTLPTVSIGKFGNGGYLPGDTCGFRAPDSSSINFSTTTDFSIVFWIKTTDTNSYLVRKFSGTGPGYRTQIVNGNISFALTDGSNTSTITSSSAINDGIWHQVIAIADRSENLKLYIDNVSAANPVSTVSVVDIGNTATFQISAGYTSLDGNLEGYIDEVRIYNRALSPTEMKQLYDFAPGPLAYYDFEEGSGAIANDKSGNGYTGTINSGPAWTTGQFGKGLAFSGSSSQDVTITGMTGKLDKTLTVEAWVDYQGITTSGFDRVIGRGWVGNGWLLGLWDSSGVDRTYCGIGQSTVQYAVASTTVTPGKYHLALTYDGTTLRCYVNGAYTGQNTSIPNAAFDTSSNIIIADVLTDNIKIDEVKIYNYARTQKQILQDMAGSSTGASAKVGSPLVHYKFDEGFGSTVNNSGIGGTINGTLGTGSSSPSWSTGKSGKALNFNGTTSYLTVPNENSLKPGTSDFSFSLWFKTLSNNPSYCAIAYKGNGDFNTQDGWLLRQYSNGNIGFHMGDGTNNLNGFTVASALNTNQWYHLTIVVDRKNGFYSYIDGKLNSSYITNTSSYTVSGPALQLGKDWSNSNYFFNGLIDEFKYYNYALSADEVKQDYNQGSTFVFGTSNQTIGATTTSLEYCLPGDTSHCSPPIAEWKFEKGVGTTAYDTSSNNNHGLISNSTWVTGKIGKALNFNGTNATVNLGQITSLNTAGSLEFWFKYRPNGATYERILSVFDDSNNEFRILLDNSTPRKLYWIHKKNNVTTGYQAADFDNNLWHHVAYVSDIGTSTSKMYLDGTNIYSTTGNVQAYNYSANWYLGSSTSTNYWFPGLIDQVRIYNYARTPAQVAWDYNQGAPIGHWKLDECQGTTIHDSSGKNRHGTLSVGASGTQTSPGTCPATAGAWGNGKLGKLNASLNFDGSDDWISLGNNALGNLGEYFTVSAWIKTVYSGSQIIMSEYEAGICGDSSFSVNSNKLLFSDGSLSSISGNKIVNDNLWHQVVFTSQIDSSQLYVDGILDATSTDVDWRNACSNTDVKIGSRSGTNPYPFQGQIDDVRIYNYALTPTQIKTLYNGGSVNFR